MRPHKQDALFLHPVCRWPSASGITIDLAAAGLPTLTAMANQAMAEAQTACDLTC